MWNKQSALVLAAGAAAILSIATPDPVRAGVSNPITCGATLYAIKPGDTLRAIAIRAYGNGAYQIIYKANRDVLSSPSLLRVGERLFIPCLDGSGPGTRRAAVALLAGTPEPEPEAAETMDGSGTGPGEDTAGGRTSVTFRSVGAARPTIPAPEGGGSAVANPAPNASETPVAARTRARNAVTDTAAGTRAASAARTTAMPELPADAEAPLRLLARSPFPPFAGRELPEGGLVPAIIGRAMLRAGVSRPYDMVWQDARTPVADAPPPGAHDIAFPWVAPDCGRPSALSAGERALCTHYTFSEPVFAREIGFYFRAGDERALAADPGLLFGQRLCRPAGRLDLDLAAEDLVEPNVERLAPATAADCFTLLAEGRVDTVSLGVEVAERTIGALALEDTVVRAEFLGSHQTLHAIAPKSNAEALALIAILDATIAEMQLSGELDEIAAQHLDERRLAAR